MSKLLLLLNITAPGFIPTQLADLEIWYDAAIPSTASGTSITAAGGLVSQWDNKPVSGDDAVQATGDDQPTTNATTINGRNVIDFADKDFNLPTIAKAGNASASTVFIVFAASVAQTNPILTANTGGTVNYGLSVTSSNRVQYSAFGTSATSPSGPSFDTLAHVAIGWNDGVNIKAYVDGGTPTSAAVGTPDTLDGGAFMGTHNFNAAHYDGSIAEMVQYGRDLSATEINSILTYFSNKWGVATTPIV